MFAFKVVRFVYVSGSVLMYDYIHHIARDEMTVDSARVCSQFSTVCAVQRVAYILSASVL